MGRLKGHFFIKQEFFRPDKFFVDSFISRPYSFLNSGINYAVTSDEERYARMATAKKGDRVKINYTGTIQDGTVFDSTLENEECSSGDCGCGSGPKELLIGEGSFLLPIEEALVGMKPGEKKSIVIPAEDAFGEYDEERVFSIPRSDLPDDLNPEVGDEIVLVNEEEEELAVVVMEMNDEEITFDSNHPLAGEDLSFEFELVEIL